MDKHLRSTLAELVGTFALVFISAGAVCATHLGADGPAQHSLLALSIYVGLAYGFALTIALAITIPYDGGYLNPAITLMLWVYKRLDGVKTVALIFVQLLGAAIAGGLLRFIVQNEIVLKDTALGTPHVNPQIANFLRSQVFSGVVTEFCLTFVLTIVIFGTLIDPRASRPAGSTRKWLSPLWAGLTMFVIVLAGYPITGASANPARWFGTVVWENTVDVLQPTHPFRDHLAYWVGPVLGALLAGGVYNALMMPAEDRGTIPAPGTVSTPSGVKTGAASTLFRSKK